MIFLKELLQNIYTTVDHEAGYSHPEKLYKAVKEYGITKKHVKNFLSTQKSYTVHKKANYKYKRRQTTSPRINNLFQADLMIMDKIYRQNSHFKVLLVVIDVLSRYLYVYPLKSKSGLEVAKAFDNLFAKVNPPVRFLQTDRGLEFYNRHVKAILKKYNVKLFSTYSHLKASVVERVIGTLRSKIQRYLTHNNTNKYINVLPEIVNSYNNTIHSRTKFKPSEANESNQLEIWHNSFDKFFKMNKKVKQKFFKNDYVRILINKGPFVKGSSKTFSEKIYVINDVIKSIPIMYKLEDSNGIVNGSFYNEELIKVTV